VDGEGVEAVKSNRGAHVVGERKAERKNIKKGEKKTKKRELGNED